MAQCLRCQGTGCVRTWARMQTGTWAIGAETRRSPSSMLHSLKGNSSPSCIHWRGCVLVTRWAHLSLKSSLRFARAAWHISHVSHQAVMARLLHQTCHSPLLLVNWVNSKHRLTSRHLAGPTAQQPACCPVHDAILLPDTAGGVAPARLHSQCGFWMGAPRFGRGRELWFGDRRQFGLCILRPENGPHSCFLLALLVLSYPSTLPARQQGPSCQLSKFWGNSVLQSENL